MMERNAREDNTSISVLTTKEGICYSGDLWNSIFSRRTNFWKSHRMIPNRFHTQIYNLFSRASRVIRNYIENEICVKLLKCKYN